MALIVRRVCMHSQYLKILWLHNVAVEILLMQVQNSVESCRSMDCMVFFYCVVFGKLCTVVRPISRLRDVFPW